MKENKENTLKVIDQNIKRTRLLKGLTQEQLAEKLDKSINFNRFIKAHKFLILEFFYCTNIE